MKAYSNDLRERIIAAWKEGKTQQWIEKTYRVSSGSIKRYIKRYRATGSVGPTQQRRQEAKINQAYEPALRALVDREPTARLDQYCSLWQQETGIQVSIQTMSRMLVKRGLRQKNDGRRA